MEGCFSFTTRRDQCFRFSFSRAGLKSTTTDLGDGTVIHCWVPKAHKDSKPSLLLLHGIGANAMWQWNDFVSPLTHRFNVYVPDLLFFGDSYTARPERSEAFQAQCVAALLKALGVRTTSVVGISYGGFVAYSLAAQFPERVEKVVLCCAGVCLEEKDMDEGMFQVKSIDEAVNILLPQTPEKMRQLVQLTFAKPIKVMPTCFLTDFIHVMCTENRQERKELIETLYKDRKLSNLPKINQPTLLIWGEQDLVFPMELAHRLKRHLGENAQLVVIKNAGHALNVEKPKEMYKNFKSFLIDPITPSMQNNYSSFTNAYKGITGRGKAAHATATLTAATLGSDVVILQSPAKRVFQGHSVEPVSGVRGVVPDVAGALHGPEVELPLAVEVGGGVDAARVSGRKERHAEGDHSGARVKGGAEVVEGGIAKGVEGGGGLAGQEDEGGGGDLEGGGPVEAKVVGGGVHGGAG
ncbi:Monoacylglycerol lipase ABHD6, partial [Mucuna pruriens]